MGLSQFVIDIVSSLIDTFLTTKATQAKGLEGYSYDFNTNQFRDADGQPVSIRDLATDVSSFDRSSGNTEANLAKATAQRNVYAKSLIPSKGGAAGEARNRLLGEL